VASKWGLRGLTKTAGQDLRQLHSSWWHPHTDDGRASRHGGARGGGYKALAIQRIAEPEEITCLVLFVASDEAIRDELHELSRGRGHVFLTCDLADDGTVCAAAVGELEGKQQQLTFRLVQDHGETDAEELMREHGAQERVKHATPWNNRLSALASLGLVVETRQGRLKRYPPLLKGV
jgi:hypothetical protein